LLAAPVHQPVRMIVEEPALLSEPLRLDPEARLHAVAAGAVEHALETVAAEQGVFVPVADRTPPASIDTAEPAGVDHVKLRTQFGGEADVVVDIFLGRLLVAGEAGMVLLDQVLEA